MNIGAHVLRNGLFVAPMAGITDRPFRRLARRYGAALAVSEMVSSRPELRASRKTRLRLDHCGEASPISVQIAGADPAMLDDVEVGWDSSSEPGARRPFRRRIVSGRPVTRPVQPGLTA